MKKSVKESTFLHFIFVFSFYIPIILIKNIDNVNWTHSIPFSMILSLTSNKSFLVEEGKGAGKFLRNWEERGSYLMGEGNPWPTIQTAFICHILESKIFSVNFNQKNFKHFEAGSFNQNKLYWSFIICKVNGWYCKKRKNICVNKIPLCSIFL